MCEWFGFKSSSFSLRGRAPAGPLKFLPCLPACHPCYGWTGHDFLAYPHAMRMWMQKHARATASASTLELRNRFSDPCGVSNTRWGWDLFGVSGVPCGFRGVTLRPWLGSVSLRTMISCSMMKAVAALRSCLAAQISVGLKRWSTDSQRQRSTMTVHWSITLVINWPSAGQLRLISR